MGSPRNDAQGTVGDGRERELSDVAGTPRRSDTVQQGVAAAVSFTIARASTTGVQAWQEGNQGEVLGLILTELQDARQRQTAAREWQTTAMACLEQKLESFTREQATLRTEMLQQTAILCEGKDSLAHLQQRLEKMEGQMQQQAEAMDDLQDVLEERLDEVQQQVRESDAKTLDKLGALDSKIDKLTHVQEQQTKMHTAHFMDLQEVTTKARGKIHEFEREVERLRAEGRTANRQLRQEVDCIFRNELEKIKDNELASITDQLREIETGKNKRLTASILTMLQASEREIQQELDQQMKRGSDLLQSEILDQTVRLIRICDDTCAGIKEEHQKELTVFAQRTDKNLADSQKKLNRSLQAMGKKFTGSQKELNHALQGLEEKFKGLTQDAEDKSTGMTEALEKRLQSGITELDTKITELDTKLTSLDSVVQHHVRRREKMESLKKENELAAQKATTLITAYKEGMEELRQELERTIESKSGGNTAFEQSMEEKLSVSTVNIQRLQKEFEQFKNNQLGEHTGQQANSLLGQMVEKLGQIVEQQTGFFGTMLPKLLEQQTARPLLLQKIERQKMEAVTKQHKDSIPTTALNKTSGVLPNLREANTAAEREIPGDDIGRRNSHQQAFPGVSGTKADVMGLNPNTVTQEVQTKAQETNKTGTTTPSFRYACDDSDKRSMLIDILKSSASEKGNVIIFVNGDQRLYFLQELLRREGFDTFSRYQPCTRRILITTDQDIDSIKDSITGIPTTEMDRFFWQTFLDGVTTVLNYDAPTVIEEYKWRLTGGTHLTNAKDLTYAKKDVHYTSFIDRSNHELCFDLQELLSDSRELERLRMTAQPYVPAFVQDMAKIYVSQMSPQAAGRNAPPKYRVGASSQARPASGSREFRSTFNAKAAGAPPKEVSWPSEVRREHVGMRDGDWYCTDCHGLVWGSRVECDSKKCQRRRLENGTSAYEMSDSSSRPMEREPSMSYTPPVANERAELKDISFVIDGLEDTSCSTDNSPAAAFTRSGEQAELKRARGVRDPAYQREILQNRKIVWHADKGIWVSQKAPGGFDTVIEATTEV